MDSRFAPVWLKYCVDAVQITQGGRGSSFVFKRLRQTDVGADFYIHKIEYFWHIDQRNRVLWTAEYSLSRERPRPCRAHQRRINDSATFPKRSQGNLSLPGGSQAALHRRLTSIDTAVLTGGAQTARRIDTTTRSTLRTLMLWGVAHAADRRAGQLHTTHALSAWRRSQAALHRKAHPHRHSGLTGRATSKAAHRNPPHEGTSVLRSVW